MEYKFTLSIGYSNAGHEEIVDVSDEELGECKTRDQKDKVVQGWWDDWSGNYIDGGWYEVEGNE